MSLAIQTNVSALYAQGALRSNQSKLASTMERLSTGIRVNGAKDDAAGLAIGQNITSQIRGLDQAVRNINDGANLVETAEGGLNSVSNMLQRMRELAVQAANGTYSDVQREYLNKECQQLKTAIGQVVDTTMWNDQKLLDGSFSKPIQIGSDVGAKMDITIPSASLIASTTNRITTVSATKAGGVVGSTALASGDLTINSTPIGGAAASAKDVAAAINLQTSTTGVTATARATVSTAATYSADYNVDGTKAWTKLLGSYIGYANALTTGLDGSVYVGGFTNGALDDGQPYFYNDAFLTKYSADGTRVWARHLDLDVGGRAFNDEVTALTTGLDGSIYISGYSSSSTLNGHRLGGGSGDFLSKYSADGTKAWTTRLGASPNALTTGLDGSIYVSGAVGGDAFLTKYSSDGTKAWTQLLGTSRNDAAYALTTGLDGSIYVGGTTNDALDGQTYNGAGPGYGDAFLTKYSADGTKAWTKQMGTSGADYAYALTTGLDGSIYVSGKANGAHNGFDGNPGGVAFLTKYSADGTEDWTQQLGTSGWDYANALTTGLDGSIYVSGHTAGALDGQTYNGGAGDAFLTKYSANGTKAWTKLLGTSGNDDARALTTGLDGSIYVSGWTNGALDGQTNGGGVGGSGDAFLTKFSVLSGTIAADAIRINGTDIGAIGSASTAEQRSTQMAAAINAVSTSTGVSASANTSTGGVTLSAADGRNIEISTLSSAAITSNQTGIALSGSVSGDRTVTTLRSGIDLNSSSSAGITVAVNALGSTATGLTGGTVPATSTTVTTVTNTDRVTMDLSTVDKSRSSIAAIDGTIDAVNNTRATLGSYINRLIYAADNVANISSNATQSRSTIIDTDYALETTALAKNQIIQQAATAMLAQANQQPQAVMALLKNL